uniref:uncharacterized protein n=1 Tax=Myxine glutinosa TaxID=7769 RepID=UPI00358F2ADB
MGDDEEVQGMWLEVPRTVTVPPRSETVVMAELAAVRLLNLSDSPRTVRGGAIVAKCSRVVEVTGGSGFTCLPVQPERGEILGKCDWPEGVWDMMTRSEEGPTSEQEPVPQKNLGFFNSFWKEISNFLPTSILKEPVPQKNPGFFNSFWKELSNFLPTSILKEPVPQKNLGFFNSFWKEISNFLPTSILKNVVLVKPQELFRSTCNKIYNILPTSFLKTRTPEFSNLFWKGFSSILPASTLKNIVFLNPQELFRSTWNKIYDILQTFLKIEPSMWSSPKSAPTHWTTPATEIATPATEIATPATEIATPATEIAGNETTSLDEMDVHESMDDEKEEMVEVTFEGILRAILVILALRLNIFCLRKWIKKLQKIYTKKVLHKEKKMSMGVCVQASLKAKVEPQRQVLERGDAACAGDGLQGAMI